MQFGNYLFKISFVSSIGTLAASSVGSCATSSRISLEPCSVRHVSQIPAGAESFVSIFFRYMFRDVLQFHDIIVMALKLIVQ